MPRNYSASSGHPQVSFNFSGGETSTTIHNISRVRLNASHQEFRNNDIILLYYNGTDCVFISRYTTGNLASVDVTNIPKFFRYFDVVNNGQGMEAIFQEMGISEVEIALAQFAKYVTSTRHIGSAS